MNISGLLGISRSGLNHLQTNLDTTANNIANVNTNGYQAQTTHFQSLMENAIGAEETLFNGNAVQYGASMGAKATTTTSFAQGNLAGTAQPLDLAIQGNGFFGVRDQTGQLLLSRAGNFHLSENKQLVNSEGYPVAMTTNVPTPQWPDAQQIAIDASGQLTTEENGQTRVLGQLTLYQPTNTENITPVGNQLYRAGDQALLTSQTNPAAFGSVLQGQLEQSTVDLATSMTDLLTTQRAYGLNTKAMQTADEMWSVINRFTDYRRKNMIRLTKVSKKFSNGTLALADISVAIPQGEFIYVVGPSGAGKSTLFKLLLKEEELSAGSIQVGNVLLEQLKDRHLYMVRRQVGIVGQEDLLLPYLTVAKNVDYALQVLGTPRKLRQEKTAKALQLVGMFPQKDHYPEELSVGQRKKVAIARAIVTEPAVLIADEPTANLDAKSAVEVMKLLLRINQVGATILLATHDSTMVNTVRNRVVELQNGRLVRDEYQGGYTRFADPKDTYVW